MLKIVLWCPSGDSHLDNDYNLLSYLPLKNGTYFTSKVKNTAPLYFNVGMKLIGSLSNKSEGNEKDKKVIGLD